MSEGPVIAVRFGLFAIEGLLFGVPLFGLYALRAPQRGQIPFRAWLIPLSLCAAGLNIVGFALLLASMSGTSIDGLDLELARLILLNTRVGWAFALRLAATMLALCLVLLAPVRRTDTMASAAALSGIALASLAWNGHGVATEGALAWPHLLADIVHLLAAGAWIGAIACFFFIVGRPTASLVDLAVAQRSLSGFGIVGSIIVALLIATGLVNGMAVLGAQPFSPPSGSTYMVLMGGKLALFGLMLALAALHRFRLVPLRSSVLPASRTALGRIKATMAVEFAAAVLVLGQVAWLGILEPGW
ncbi:copper homeostasis membrane protein CopD [Sphingobium sp. CFD-1]|uniref:copper homeostasis membrane protein CopD n=1 Tax=Sphingobium sp. CFD-1 TaxID=2878545 RepID=UPI00214B2FE4|nr:copper homeostasis membrane protein CopD [Sphingobium sp. CFD-1]